jgi:methylated-DNA-protein-cysteine methyltransferase-like protein
MARSAITNIWCLVRKVSFSERVYDMVRRVPHGRVVSYGGIAAMLGHPRAARGVGHALHALDDNTDVPWWRVINRNGEISIRGVPHAPQLQRALLQREGIRFDRRGRVDWKRFGWTGDDLARDP